MAKLTTKQILNQAKVEAKGTNSATISMQAKFWDRRRWILPNVSPGTFLTATWNLK